MYELMLALFIVVGGMIGLEAAQTPDVRLQMNQYTMKVQLRVNKLTLEDAGKFEHTIREWFPEASIVEVVVEPDTTK